MKSSSCATYAALLGLLCPAVAHAEAIGTITHFSGAGTILRAEHELPLSYDIKIEADDIIQTAAGTQATIEFKDKSVLTLGEEATLTVDAFIYDPEQAANNQSTLNIGKGFFRYLSGKLDKKKVKINTPISTIGIRGTAFFGEVKESGETAVSLVHCCADVTSEAGTTALDREGFYTEVGGKNQSPTSAGLTPEHFYKAASTSLGMSIQQLGLMSYTPQRSLEEIKRELQDKQEKTPANRTQYPHL